MFFELTATVPSVYLYIHEDVNRMNGNWLAKIAKTRKPNIVRSLERAPKRCYES
jgi:hypothetical protein